MKLIFVVLLIFLLLPASPSYAASVRPCTDQEATQANSIYGSVSRKDWTWDKLYKSFRDYGHCADEEQRGTYAAELAYAYEDAVQHLLLEDWDHFSKFVEIDRKDKNFRKFVFLYIDEEISGEDAGIIIRAAKQHCPGNAKSLCDAVEAAVKAIPPVSTWDTEHSW